MQTVSKNYLLQLAKLKQKKYRDQSGLYMISGVNAVESAVNAPHPCIQEILLNERRIALLDELNLKDKTKVNIPIYSLSERDFARISDERSPQGIAAVAQKRTLDIQNNPPQSREIIYLDRINDPGNLGAIIRTALWFGIKTILLSPGSADPYQPKVARASTGYITYMDLYEQVSVHDLSNFNKTRHYSFIAAVVNGAESLYKLKPGKNVALIFGSEAHGIAADLLQLCDRQVTIPKPGYGESLNLAVSTALFLYQLKQKE